MNDKNTTDIFCLDSSYSTTRIVTREISNIVSPPNSKYETLLSLPEGEDRKGSGGLRLQNIYKKSFSDKPLITVITVVFNGERYLENTILSVLNQTYDNLEYIIIDGGSTDGTVDIIKRYEAQIDYWVSEKDGGISNAFNKGISLATGDIIGIINADDWYQLDALQLIAGKLAAQKEKEIVFYGGMFYHNPVDGTSNEVLPNIDRIWDKMSIFHPAMFVSSSVYQRFGKFSNDYMYAMDCELVHRFLANNVQFIEIKSIISNMRLNGVSDVYYQRGLKEFCKSAIHYGHSRQRAYYFYCDILVRKFLLKTRYGNLLQRLKRLLFVLLFFAISVRCECDS